MKNVLCLSLLLASAAILWSSCATSEEKAAQMAQLSANVTNALNNRDYKIAIDRMYPMRGSSRHVSYGYSVEVRNDTLFSYLPYFGRAYNVPYGGSHLRPSRLEPLSLDHRYRFRFCTALYREESRKDSLY